MNVKEALVILKGQNSALGFQNLTVWGVCRVSNFESLLLAEFCPFRIDPPMEPEQERLSKLYSGSGIQSLPELNPNPAAHLMHPCTASNTASYKCRLQSIFRTDLHQSPCFFAWSHGISYDTWRWLWYFHEVCRGATKYFSGHEPDNIWRRHDRHRTESV